MRIVGISGSLSQPSRTTALVNLLLEFARDTPGVQTSLVEIASLSQDLAQSLDFQRLPLAIKSAQQQLASADLLIVASPVFKASYTGLLKHFFDLLDSEALRDKRAILAATGGSDYHALILEHQLRPLLSYFGVHTHPSTLYVRDNAFIKTLEGYVLSEGELRERAKSILNQALTTTSAPSSLSSMAA